jgi:hypothetical protein
MYDRYRKTQKIINQSDVYKTYFQKNKIKSITQYATYRFGNLKDISKTDIQFVLHTVEPFEKLYNISNKYYNSPEYGWLICYLNEKPNEMEISAGDILKIYYPIDEVLGLLNNV